MVRHLVRLSWQTIARGLEVGSQIRAVAGTLAGGSLVFTVLGTLAVLALRVIPAAFQPVWVIALALLLALGAFALGLSGNPADALDNRALAIASGRPTGLAVSTLLAAHLTLPALFALIPYTAMAVLIGIAAQHWLAIAVVVLAWLQWVMLWRLGTRTGRWFTERHIASEGRAAVTYVLLMLLVVLIAAGWLLPWQDALTQESSATFEVLAPAPVANVFLASYGADPLVVLAVNGALLVLLWVTDLVLATRAGRTVMFRTQYGGRVRFGAFRFALGSATRNIAARTWIAWLRDARYQVLLGTVIVLPPVLLLPVWVGGAPVEVLRLFLLPLFAMCLGWALHNDTAYDFTALWVHVTGGLPGRADRAGRAIPTLVTGTIVSLVGALLLGLALHDQVTAIGVFAVSIAVLGTTVGGSSIMSTVAPYPVARPGDSPFSQPVRSWGSAVVWQPFALLIEVALCLPVAWLAWQAITGQSVADAWLAAAAGFGTAAVAITIGILVGGRIFESRRTALLTFAQSY